MPTINSWNNAVLDANVLLNGGTVGIGTDNAANAITIGTGTVARSINIGRSAAAHVLQIGVNNGVSSTSIEAGTGNMTINSGGTIGITATSTISITPSNSALTLNSGTGTLAISNDAAATTVNLGTGAGTKTVTIGSTTGGTVAMQAGASVSTLLDASLMNQTFYSGANTTGVSLRLKKSRTGGIITSGDTLGLVSFEGYDGTQYVNGASIQVASSGTIAANRVAGTMTFRTHPDSASGVPATTRMTIASTGAVTIAAPDSGTALTVTGDLTTTIPTSGATVTSTVSNTSNTASSAATHTVSTAGATAGDATYIATTTTTAWAFGVDNSVTSPTADPFVISQGSVLGTNNIMSVATSGEINFPLQPAFLGFLPSNDVDQTGNAGIYTLGTVTALTEVFDQNGDFTTAGVFTAPVTGKYYLSAQAYVTGETIATTITVNIVTSNRTYGASTFRTAGNLNQNYGFSVLADMDASDTATVTIVCNGEAANTDDIVGGSNNATRFSGYLAC